MSQISSHHSPVHPIVSTLITRLSFSLNLSLRYGIAGISHARLSSLCRRSRSPVLCHAHSGWSPLDSHDGSTSSIWYYWYLARLPLISHSLSQSHIYAPPFFWINRDIKLFLKKNKRADLFSQLNLH